MSNPSRDPIVGDWRGEPTYGCPLCPFETINEGNFADHMRAVHYLPEGADPVEEPAHPIAEAPAEAEPPIEEPTPAPEVVDPEPAPTEAVPVEPTPEPEPHAAEPEHATQEGT